MELPAGSSVLPGESVAVQRNNDGFRLMAGGRIVGYFGSDVALKMEACLDRGIRYVGVVEEMAGNVATVLLRPTRHG